MTETTDPLWVLARETVEKILLQGRDISMTMDEWKRRRPDLAKDLDEEVAAFAPIIEAALRLAQRGTREQIEQAVKGLYDVKTGFCLRCRHDCAEEVLATLRSDCKP